MPRENAQKEQAKTKQHEGKLNKKVAELQRTKNEENKQVLSRKCKHKIKMNKYVHKYIYM